MAKKTKVKLAILLYGVDADKLKIFTIMNSLQNQLNKIGSDEVEVVYKLDQGETTDQEKRDFLLAETESQKYVFINALSVIEDNFLILRLNAVKLHKKSIDQIELGIYSKLSAKHEC